MSGVEGLPDDAVQRLAEALRLHRWHAEETPDGSLEEDYRPGAPCMDCGDYPGPRHERSDCVRALARALAPVVAALMREGAAAELEAEAAYDDAAPDEQYARYLFAQRLRARAKNLRGDIQ